MQGSPVGPKEPLAQGGGVLVNLECGEGENTDGLAWWKEENGKLEGIGEGEWLCMQTLACGGK